MMTKVVLGILIGLGAAFIWASLIETKERKQLSEYERLMERMRKLP